MQLLKSLYCKNLEGKEKGLIKMKKEKYDA